VVKTYHKSGKVNAKGDSLMVAPCFPQCMAPVIAFQVDLAAPAYVPMAQSTHAFAGFGTDNHHLDTVLTPARSEWP